VFIQRPLNLRPKIILVVFGVALAGTMLLLTLFWPKFDSQAASITSISPNSGPATGGTIVTIIGVDLGATAGAPDMQQSASSYCNTMPIWPAAGGTVVMKDVRNGQDYTIRRLQDRNCWMIDNLKLELGVVNADPTLDTTVLEPANTNVATNVPIYFTQNGTAGGQHLTGMAGNFTTSGYNTRNGSSAKSTNTDAWRQNNPSSTTSCLNGNAYNSASLTGCGYLYNWYTAVAGSATQASHAKAGNVAQGSICPAGWRLPRANSGTTADSTDTTFYYGDLAILNISMWRNAYSVPGYVVSDYYIHWIPSGEFRGTYSGQWVNGFDFQGITGKYWASTVSNNTLTRAYVMEDGYVSAGVENFERYFGLGVRCMVDADATAPPVVPTVKFGGVAATNVALSADGKTITATAPAHAAGVVDVVVGSGSGAITLAGGFTYREQMRIDSITPNHGSAEGNTTVTINGANFNVPGSTAPTNPIVTFGGIRATVVNHSNDRIVVTTPAHAIGLVSVTVDNGSGSFTLPPVYINPAGDLSDPNNVSSGYLYQAPYISLTIDSNNVTVGGGPITPSTSGAYAYSPNTTLVKTDHLKGYTLALSTDKSGSDSRASDLKHTGLNQWIVGTANTCSWNDTTKILTNTPNAILNNTWGFTLNVPDRDSQKLCRVPARNNALTIKSTAAPFEADPGDRTTFYYGAKLDYAQAAGRYQTTVVYTAVGNV
jgi:uncharacterized protein (TIGR02145 family)